MSIRSCEDMSLRRVYFRTLGGSECSLLLGGHESLSKIAEDIRGKLQGHLYRLSIINDETQKVTTQEHETPFADNECCSFTVHFYWESTWQKDIEGSLLAIGSAPHNMGWPQVSVDAQHAGSAYSTPFTTNRWTSEGGLSLMEAAKLLVPDLLDLLKFQPKHCLFLKPKHYYICWALASKPKILDERDLKVLVEIADSSKILDVTNPLIRRSVRTLSRFLQGNQLASCAAHRLRTKTKSFSMKKRIRSFNARRKDIPFQKRDL